MKLISVIGSDTHSQMQISFFQPGQWESAVDDAENSKAVAFYRKSGATHVAEKLYFRFSGAEPDDCAGLEEPQQRSPISAS